MTWENREEVTPHDPYRRVFAALFELTKAVNAGEPLRALLTGVTESIADLVAADGCTILLFDRESNNLFCSASSGASDVPDDVDGLLRCGEGAEGWVALHGIPLRTPDAAFDPRVASASEVAASGSLLCVPLAGKEGVMGTLTVRAQRSAAFVAEQEELLLYLGGSIVKDLENARLYRLSITDNLTGAYNRQYLYQRLSSELDRFRRYSDPLSVVLFDVDRFKLLNDTYGHSAGDFILKSIVHAARATIREVDGLVRYGGEEFLLLLPKTPLPGAAEVAERLRAAVAEARFDWGGQSLRVSISLGVAAFEAGMRNEEALLKRADELLYRAKGAGRNRVAVG